MVKEAYGFLIPLILLSLGSLWLGLWGMAVVFMVLALFVAYFFRDPHRVIPDDPHVIVSPADGKVVKIEEGDAGTLVSIFLSLFDVHVNRAPISGRIEKQEYRPGKFLLAWDERASVENEQQQMTILGERRIQFALIAGLVARRIVPWTKLNQTVQRGDRIAVIRFGSRVDILIPRDCKLEIVVGSRVQGGSTVLAYWV